MGRQSNKSEKEIFQKESEIGYLQLTPEHRWRWRKGIKWEERHGVVYVCKSYQESFTETGFKENTLDTSEERTNQKMGSQKNKLLNSVWGQSEQFSHEPREAGLNQSFCKTRLYWSLETSSLGLGIARAEKEVFWVQPKPHICTAWVQLSSIPSSEETKVHLHYLVKN